MTKWTHLPLAGLLILALAGCTSAKAPEKKDPAAPQPLTTSDFDAGRQQAEAFQSCFWQAYNSGKVDPILPFLPEKRPPKEVAEQIRRQRETFEKRYGSVTAVRFGGEMEKPFVRDYFWIIRFEKKPNPPAAAGPTATEFLFVVRVARIQNAVKVIGFGMRP